MAINFPETPNHGDTYQPFPPQGVRYRWNGTSGLWEGVPSITYWGVLNADEALAALLARGASPHHPIQDVGGGTLIATVKGELCPLVGHWRQFRDNERPPLGGLTCL